MKKAATAILVMCATTSCVSPTTVFVGPRCSTVASRTGTQRDTNVIEFNHEVDFPFTSRTVTITMPDGDEERVELVSDKQDTIRMGAGCLLTSLGCLGLSYGILNNQPLTSGLGTSVAVTGGAAMLMGWRPNQDLMIRKSDRCEEPNQALPSKAAAMVPKPVTEGHVTITADHLEIDDVIQFETGKAALVGKSPELLEDIVKVMKAHPEIGVLHIIGHTDATGDKSANKILSEARAKAVVNFLKSRGVSQPMDARGAGPDEPVCMESTPECHTKNRRVEFKFEKPAF
jgi:outer membrane protein OmpA-like peptidoglycan-associated protein